MKKTVFKKILRILAEIRINIQRAQSYIGILNSGMILYIFLKSVGVKVDSYIAMIYIIGVFLMALIGYLDYKSGLFKIECEIKGNESRNPYWFMILRKLTVIEKRIDKCQ